MNEPSIYEMLGGEEGLRKLVHEFYRQMDTLPEAQVIRKMHVDLAVSEEKLFMFLSGWSGGPQLYIEKYGHPRLRMRHFGFAIGESERDQWLLCMNRALDAQVSDERLKRELSNDFLNVADHMRNR